MNQGWWTKVPKRSIKRLGNFLWDITKIPQKQREDSKRHTLQNWIVPRRDEHGQWWWGYQKVHLVKLPESEKIAWLKSMGYDVKEKDEKE